MDRPRFTNVFDFDFSSGHDRLGSPRHLLLELTRRRTPYNSSCALRIVWRCAIGLVSLLH